MLGWSINLFRVFGIQLAVHASFFLLLAYYGYEGLREGGVAGACWRLSLIVSFFICVVLHELGHSLTAQRFGVRVPRILLLPIGGMAEFDRIPRKPSQELLITIAGPAVNFLLAGVLFLIVGSEVDQNAGAPRYSFAFLLDQLWAANVFMGAFNLLPVFPMDGGRIFRAFLAMKLPYLRASYWAMITGKILALSFAMFALFYFKDREVRAQLALLFMFIFWAGGLEYKHILRRDEEERYWADASSRVDFVSMKGEGDSAPPLIRPGRS